jgi:hypothetical protein
MYRRLSVLAGAGLLALLVSCSSSGNSAAGGSSLATSAANSAPATSAAPEPTPTPTRTHPVRATTYGSVVELRDAAVDAGYFCKHWREDDQVTNAAESGSCSDADVFCIYASTRDRDRQVRQTRANNELLKDAGIPPSVVLFGPNWSINVEDKSAANMLRATLGGVEAR